MKKVILSLIFLFICLISVVTTLHADSTLIGVNQVNVDKGEQFTLTVKLTEKLHISSGAVEISYDESLFEFNQAEWLVNGDMLCIFDENKMKGAFAFETSKEYRGIIFTATFTAKEDIPFGTHNITFNVLIKDETNKLISVPEAQALVIVGCGHKSTYFGTNEHEHWEVCNDCNQEIQRGKHTYDAGTVVKQPTAKEPGIREYRCTECGAVERAQFTASSSSCGNSASVTFVISLIAITSVFALVMKKK